MSSRRSSDPLDNYCRAHLRPKILHIGFGAFAKAHTLVFHDEMLRRCGGDEGVVAARLNSAEHELTKLDQADGIYTVGEMSNGEISLREIHAVIKTIHPHRDGPDALLDQISDPDLSIISLTITEKGYCLSGNTLNVTDPLVKADIDAPENPRTAIGYLASGLMRRHAAGLGGITILSCDNLPSNGRLCRAAVLEFTKKMDGGLHDWIVSECRFPCSVVDRITPAMTNDSKEQLAAQLGRDDPNGVLCEPFRQWVIEDDFASERPNWRVAGVKFVDDIDPYEEMKLRMLNGAHSFLAYLGALAGKQTIAECMADPVFRDGARMLMLREQAPTLGLSDGHNVQNYANTLIERFANTSLNHKTTQIAQDGSQKLPQRILEPVRSNIQAKRIWPFSAFAIAGWMHYCRRASEGGTMLAVVDPLSDQITALAQKPEGAAFVDAMLRLPGVFGDDLIGLPEFTKEIHSAYAQIRSNGVRNALSDTQQE